MHQGIIKWFDNTKGFGFAKPLKDGKIDEEHSDIMVHYSEIKNKDGESTDDFIKMHQGELIEYSLEVTKNGLKALNVMPIKNQF